MSTEAVTFTIQLSLEESNRLQQISRAEHLPEDTLLKKWVLDGLSHIRLEQACAAYRRGEMNISTAARHAEISTYEMVHALRQRGIDTVTPEQILDGLVALTDTFGAPREAREALAQQRAGRADMRE
ncbi:MAG: hypothetical protein HY784_10845 [Chloroflexi bacterium]|nr:hypothetical protein [Chloroflexota bacterium]